MPKISIAIPTCESEGRGAEFIDDLFRTIVIQQFKDYNVWVSDQSVDNSVKKTFLQFSEHYFFSGKKGFCLSHGIGASIIKSI